MARKLKRATRHKIAGIVVIAALCGSLAGAQDAAQPAQQQQQPMPAPYSEDCRVGNTPHISEAPLPNVAVALQKRKKLKILAIGASAASGRRGRRGGYTEQIEDILEKAIKGLDVVIINRGVSGELAAAAAARIKNDVALYDPDLVLWQVGTNDALAYVPLDQLSDTIVDTVKWLKAHHVDVVLAGLQFVKQLEQDDHYRAVRALIRKVAAEENVVVVRRSEAMRLLTNVERGGGGLFPEEFAQTEVGYACLAEYVARAIALAAFGRGLRPQRPPLQAPQPAAPQDPQPR
jgi:lysophospholipase L1-like esterase